MKQHQPEFRKSLKRQYLKISIIKVICEIWIYELIINIKLYLDILKIIYSIVIGDKYINQLFCELKRNNYDSVIIKGSYPKFDHFFMIRDMFFNNLYNKLSLSNNLAIMNLRNSNWNSELAFLFFGTLTR